ncbi:sensor histidine kinase [Nocardiopsis gilva]|uniref:sensor histidine kinase n=1 Tax=Nocardiopsis gilva TaxID=280236 RepID=UPI001E4CB0B9|nr:sensor domain-containing protein [Nocardiopsis gilva]
MTANDPRTPLNAVRRRRYVLSAWPWRSLAYLLTALPLMSAVTPVVTVLTLPWWLLAVLWNDHAGAQAGAPTPTQLAASAVLVLIGVAAFAACAPLVALPLAEVERRRLGIIHTEPATSGHRTPTAPGPAPWLRLRYSEAVTWRETAYLLLFVPLTLATWAVVGGAAVLVAVLLLGPLLVMGQDEPISMGIQRIDDPVEALPYALVGVVLLVAAVYLVALAAGGHGALARVLLQGPARGELEAELTEVTRSRARLVDAFEAERRRIERDLHDGAQQRLVALTMQLGLARLDLPAGSPAARTLEAAHDQAKELIVEMRELVRGIHPKVLTDLGLPAALPDLADRCALPVDVAVDLPHRLPPHIEGTAYFVVAETVTNVAKHSGATAASVRVRLEQGRAGDRKAVGTPDLLVVEVSDNGHGGAEVGTGAGTGLTGLADRVAVMDGRMLLSSPPGGPTVVRVELPCDRMDQNAHTSGAGRPEPGNRP